MSVDQCLEKAAICYDLFMAGYDPAGYRAAYSGREGMAMPEARSAIAERPLDAIRFVEGVLDGEQEDEAPLDGGTATAGRLFLTAAREFAALDIEDWEELERWASTR